MKQNKIKNWHRLVGLLVLPMALTLQAAPIKIMFLGDSITAGDASLPTSPDANKSEYVTGAHIDYLDRIAYRGELWKLLKAEGYKVDENDTDKQIDFVGLRTKDTSNFQSDNPGFDEDHNGYSGFTSSDFINGRDITHNNGNTDKNVSIHTILKNEDVADIVLLHIGTNDPGALIPIRDKASTDTNTTVNNERKILNAIFKKNPKTHVFVARIIEARKAHTFAGGIGAGEFPKWNTNDLNNEVAKMVASHPNKANITMVDMESGAGMIYDPCGTTFGDMQPFHEADNKYDFHPNPKGYKKIAQKWFDELITSKLLPDITAPVITLKGTNPIEVKLKSVYKDLGADVTDDHDKNLNVTIDSTKVDMNKEGNYTVTYNVTDLAGNKAIEVKRTVAVKKDPNFDGNNNGIPDKLEGWFTYEKATQKVILKPTGFLAVEKGLSATPSADVNAVTLVHAEAGGIEAYYISAKKDGKITTGIKDGVKDDTLSTGSFASGSDATIKKVNGDILIEIKTTLAKDDKLTIGGK